MKQCFCGCGQTVPRFPLGLRTRNKRGALVRDHVERVEGLLGSSVRSPTAERFVEEGRGWMAAIAEAVHAREDPGPEVEAGTADFMRRGRQQFSEAGIGAAMRRSGLDPREAAEAMSQGEWDPFA